MCNTLVKLLNLNTFLGISLTSMVAAAPSALFLMLYAARCGFHVVSNVAMKLIHISLFGTPSSRSDTILLRFFYFLLLFVASENKVPDARDL